MSRGVELARVFTSSFPTLDASAQKLTSGSQRGSPVDPYGSDDTVAGKRDTRYEGLAEQEHFEYSLFLSFSLLPLHHLELMHGGAVFFFGTEMEEIFLKFISKFHLLYPQY